MNVIYFIIFGGLFAVIGLGVAALAYGIIHPALGEPWGMIAAFATFVFWLTRR